jgi:hypothetical protein
LGPFKTMAVFMTHVFLFSCVNYQGNIPLRPLTRHKQAALIVA